MHDPELRLREDVECYARVMRHFGAHFLDWVGLRYRIGNPSLMHSPELTECDLRPLRDAQSRTNAKYMRDWGTLEFHALKRFSRTVLKVI